MNEIDGIKFGWFVSILAIFVSCFYYLIKSPYLFISITIFCMSITINIIWYIFWKKEIRNEKM